MGLGMKIGRTLKPAAAGMLALGAIGCTHAGDASDMQANAASAMVEAPRLISVKSGQGFDASLAALRAAVEKRGLKTFAVIDHAAGAASVDLDLRPTTLVIFGNPQGGTPLLQAEQRLGLTLPLKALVYEDAAGDVMIATTDIMAEAAIYGLSLSRGPAPKIAGALSAIREEAAGR